MTLIEFLRARLDEDEQRARRAAAADEQARDGDGPRLGEAEDYLGEALAVHIWRHSPKRVLAQVDAKRRIVELHHLADWTGPNEPPVCDICSGRDDHEELHGDWPCQTLRLLALPFAGHPNYDQDWKP